MWLTADKYPISFYSINYFIFFSYTYSSHLEGGRDPFPLRCQLRRWCKRYPPGNMTDWMPMRC